MATAFNLPDRPLITPGNPERSILFQRVRSVDPDLRMPPIARSTVDPDGVLLLQQWIQSMQ
jgi:hypothetical protein